jgi:hypothetical protein
MSGASAGDGRPTGEDRRLGEGRRLTLQLDGFAADVIDEEAGRLGVSVEELVSFSVLYYLADVDSGRIARQIATSPYPDGGLRDLRSR